MESFTFFWDENSPFCQWYPSKFIINGINFNCAEQYMMYMKAKFFNDEQIGERILEATSPIEHRSLGRQVKNFNKEKWERVCKKIVYDGNYAKFSQNPGLRAELFHTAATTIVEASPFDRIWGVGLAEDDERILDRKNWRGTNWLGEILTQIREELLMAEDSNL